MKPFIFLVVLLLAGCTFFSSEEKAARPAPDEQQRPADFEACKEQARAMIDRDETIDQDIASASPTTDVGAGIETDATLAQNLAAYRADRRYQRLVDRCMRDHGYAVDD